MTRLYARLLVLTFCALIALPGLTLAIWRSPQPLYQVRPVEYPAFALTTGWLAAFERYFMANFGQKRRLVQLHNALGYYVIGDLQSRDVLAGRDGWLFLKQSFGWESLRSEQPLLEREKTEWQQTLRAANGQLDKRGVPLLFVLVPNKGTVYPELLPASAMPARPTTRADEMLPVLEAAGVPYLDLRPPLRHAKRDGQPLYDKLDSHWNGRGAELAASLLLERVTALLGRPPEYAKLNARLVPAPSSNDLSALLVLDDYLKEDSLALLPVEPHARRLEPLGELTRLSSARLVFEVADASLPKALIIMDSFGTMLIPALTEKFRRSVWLWTRQLDLSVLDEERPDIVIFEMVERFLHDRPPKLSMPR
jgi:alginate O-acetyltransferase complex protein AlgJ